MNTVKQALYHHSLTKVAARYQNVGKQSSIFD